MSGCGKPRLHRQFAFLDVRNRPQNHRVEFIQRRPGNKTVRQIRIRESSTTKGDNVSAIVEHRLGSLDIMKATVGDYDRFWCVLLCQMYECLTVLSESRFPGFELGDMDEVCASVSDAAEDGFGILLAALPFVEIIVHLALRNANAHRHGSPNVLADVLQGSEDHLDAALRITAPTVL